MSCQGNHTANEAANCDAFKRAIEIRSNKQKDKTKQNETKTTKTQNIQPAPNSTKSYAGRMKINQQKMNVQSSETKTIDLFVDNQKKMLGEFMATMKKMQQQFFKNFNHHNG